MEGQKLYHPSDKNYTIHGAIICPSVDNSVETVGKYKATNDLINGY